MFLPSQTYSHFLKINSFIWVLLHKNSRIFLPDFSSYGWQKEKKCEFLAVVRLLGCRASLAFGGAHKEQWNCSHWDEDKFPTDTEEQQGGTDRSWALFYCTQAACLSQPCGERAEGKGTLGGPTVLKHTPLHQEHLPREMEEHKGFHHPSTPKSTWPLLPAWQHTLLDEVQN